MAIDRRKLKPISPWSIIVVLLASGIAVMLLLPTKRGLLERQLRDGDFRNAQETLKAIPWYEKARDSAYFDLTEIQLERRSLRPERTLQLEKHLQKVIAFCQKHDFKPEFVREAALVIEMHPSADRAYELAAPWLSKIPLAAREEIINSCVKKFLADNQPQRALDIYQEFFGNAITTNARVSQMVALLRQNGRSKDALEVLEKYVKINFKKLDAETLELAKLEIALLRENGRSEQAFQAIKELFHASSAQEQKQLFDLLILAAKEANRTSEVLAEIESKAEENPDDKELWILFANTATAAERHDLAVKAWKRLIAAEPQNGQYRFKLGQVYEWSGKPNDAFDTYLDALKLKVVETLDRLLDLNPGLFRDVELAQALEEVPELIRQKALELRLARLENKIGNFDVAKKWFEAALTRDPQNVMVLQEYAGLMLSLYQYEEALAVFTKVKQLSPNEPIVLRGLAETYMRMNRFQDAYDILEQLTDRAKDPQSLEDFIFLAQTMGKLDGVLRGLYLKIQMKDAAPHHYLDLGYFLYVKGDSKECLRILREGLARFPKDDAVRLQLATVLKDNKDYLEAGRVLEGSEKLLVSNASAIELYISMLIQAQKYKEASVFLRERVKPSLLESETFINFRASVAEELDNRVEAAQLLNRLYAAKPQNPYYALNYARVTSALGRTKEAKAVLAPFLGEPTPEVLKLAAEVFAAAREYREAERWQRMYLETNPPERHKAVGFLGDVLLSRGDRVNARVAYTRALDILLTDITKNSKKGAESEAKPQETPAQISP